MKELSGVVVDWKLCEDGIDCDTLVSYAQEENCALCPPNTTMIINNATNKKSDYIKEEADDFTLAGGCRVPKCVKGDYVQMPYKDDKGCYATFCSSNGCEKPSCKEGEEIGFDGGYGFDKCPTLICKEQKTITINGCTMPRCKEGDYVQMPYQDQNGCYASSCTSNNCKEPSCLEGEKIVFNGGYGLDNCPTFVCEEEKTVIINGCTMPRCKDGDYNQMPYQDQNGCYAASCRSSNCPPPPCQSQEDIRFNGAYDYKGCPLFSCRDVTGFIGDLDLVPTEGDSE
jgi:hypothetical protein